MISLCKTEDFKNNYLEVQKFGHIFSKDGHQGSATVRNILF